MTNVAFSDRGNAPRSGQERRQGQPDANEARYRAIFEGARVALWDQDFSALLDYLDDLRAQGVTDLRAYFGPRPAELAQAVVLVHVRDVNNYAVELFEAEHKEALLGELGATFLPETQSVFLDEMVALWEGHRRFESESLVRSLKGRHINVLLSISWDGERCERSLVSILDVSKQKASEQRLEALDHIARTLSSDLDLERIVQTVTDSATKLSGARFGAFFYNVTDPQGERYVLYTLSGVPREAFEKFGLPRNTAVFDPTFRGLGIIRCDDIRADPRYGHSAPHYGMPKGHLPVVSYLAVPVISRSGEVLGGLFFGHDQPGVFTDDAEQVVAGIAAHAAIAIDNARLLQAAQNEIEQRKSAEQARQQLVSIIESSDDAIVSKNLEGIIVSWNDGAERLFGYRAEDIVGKSVLTLIPEDHQDEEPKILARVRRGERVEHYDTVRRRKDGSLVDVSLSVSPVRDAAGNVVGASKIARNISMRKRVEESLARRVEEQAALYHFTNQLYRAESLDQALEAALDAILRALRCDRASILLGDATGVMRFVSWRGLSDAYRRAVEGHSPWTADTKDPRPVCVDDIAAADLDEALGATVRAEGIGALAFIPLVAAGRLFGKFMAYYDAPHEFSAAEIDLAISIARQLGFSIERLRAEDARGKAEASLRDSERRLELALAAGKMGAWEWNIVTGQVIWSPGLERLHGLEPGAFGGTVDDFQRDVHPDDLRQVEAQIRQTLETGGDYHVIYRKRHPDGLEHWLETFGSPVCDANGSVLRLAGVCMDVTDRKMAEQSLSESERRFKTLAGQVPVGIFETDAEGNCLFVNEKWRALAGLTLEQALGQGWIAALHSEDRDRVFHEWRETATCGKEFASEYRFRTPGGKVSWVSGTALGLRDSIGAITGYIGSVIDITERKRAEEQQALLINELNHRVKNTLATVQAIAAQTLRAAKADPAVQHSLEARLIALSDAHSILTQENWEGAEMHRIIAQALRPHASEERLRMEGPPIRLSPRSALAVAMGIHELATNAVKYGALSNARGQVSVTWSVDASNPDTLNLEWIESGGPRVSRPRRFGFGSRLIERNLAHDLDGQAKIDFRPEGLVCTITSRLQPTEIPTLHVTDKP